jgi:sec-independent protein translocase protein TatA
MGGLGISHWIIILVIVLVLFGAGRVSNIMGELGKGIKSFKAGMGDEEDENYRRFEERRRMEEERRAREQRQLSGDRREPIDVTPRPSDPVAPPPPPRDEEIR